MNIKQNEIIALSIVNREGDTDFNAMSYRKIISKLKTCLNSSYVSFSVHRHNVFIEYIAEGTSSLVKIQSKRSLLEGV